MKPFGAISRRECFASIAALATLSFNPSGYDYRASASAAEPSSEEPLAAEPKVVSQLTASQFQEQIIRLLGSNEEICSSLGFPKDRNLAVAEYNKRLESYKQGEIDEIVICLKQLVEHVGLSSVPGDNEVLNRYLKEFNLEEKRPQKLWDDQRLNRTIKSITLACLSMDDKATEKAWRKIQKGFAESVVLDHQAFSPFLQYDDMRGSNDLAKYFALFVCRRMSFGGMVMPDSESRFLPVARKCVTEGCASSSSGPGDPLWKDVLSLWCLSSKRSEISPELLNCIGLHPDSKKGLAFYVPAAEDSNSSAVRRALREDYKSESEPSLIKFFKEKNALIQQKPE